MEKWADYLISAVRYDSDETHIEKVRAHLDGDKVGSPIDMTRLNVINKIASGYDFVTIFKNKSGKYNKGEKVIVVTINGTKYIKTNNNKIEEDNLENLPRF